METNFGHTIKRAREVLNIDAKNIAIGLGITRQELHDYESNAKEILEIVMLEIIMFGLCKWAKPVVKTLCDKCE